MKLKKNKKTIFICQLTDSSLKVIKCLGDDSKREFVDLAVEAIPADIDDKSLTQKLTLIFNRLGYSNNPVIVSLPCQKATCRYLKVPAQIPSEIERISSLQASHYLPYPNEELITGYQFLSADAEGYSDINLVIVHKDGIERYVKIFKELKILNFTIALSSYGLVNLYDYLKQDAFKPVMIIDIDASQSELAIVSRKKLIFSRSFKVDRSLPQWENLFIDELSKSRDAYLKGISKEPPVKIMVTGGAKFFQGLTEVLNRQMGLPVEVLSYDKIKFSGNLLNEILSEDNSFASLIGLGLKAIEEPLNLLTKDIKEESKKISQRKDYTKLALLGLGMVFILGLGVVKNLDNKALYLKKLKVELDKITQEAKSLENKEKRLKVLESRLQKKPSTLDVLYEIYHLVPAQISLVNLNYEEDKQIILRGQSRELNSVFAFALQLKTPEVFKNFNIKVKYATKKITPLGDMIDFEIVCSER